MGSCSKRAIVGLGATRKGRSCDYSDAIGFPVESEATGLPVEALELALADGGLSPLDLDGRQVNAGANWNDRMASLLPQQNDEIARPPAELGDERGRSDRGRESDTGGAANRARDGERGRILWTSSMLVPRQSCEQGSRMPQPSDCYLSSIAVNRN